ncbi:hypothetical protein [Fusobacterium ulcerans]|uniref:hypothetical protein n=1 Tax=Fusobacterium ulcerans TaxID=861 RepID=UPI001032E902|nr:hypothetical protein [Fusobacterium ulcerans]
MKNKRIENIKLTEKIIDENFKDSIIEIILVVDVYLKLLREVKEDIEKSFIIIAGIASLNSLYEKYMKDFLNKYLKVWSYSKKGKEKELKVLLSIIYKKGKFISNFEFKDILEYKDKCKNENIIELVEERSFKDKYKSFESTEDIYIMLVQPFFNLETIEEKIRAIQEIIDTELEDKNIDQDLRKIDIELLKNINQIKSQIRYIYKNIRTNLIHGDFSNFEDIYISKSFDSKLFGKYCILWMIIIYLSLKNLTEDIK